MLAQVTSLFLPNLVQLVLISAPEYCHLLKQLYNTDKN